MFSGIFTSSMRVVVTQRSTPLSEEYSTPILPGFCLCGCGRWLGYWKRGNAALGRVKGQAKRFAIGHASKLLSRTLAASETKHCCRCKLRKLRAEFCKDRSRADGLAAECKSCRKADNRGGSPGDPRRRGSGIEGTREPSAKNAKRGQLRFRSTPRSGALRAKG